MSELTRMRCALLPALLLLTGCAAAGGPPVPAQTAQSAPSVGGQTYRFDGSGLVVLPLEGRAGDTVTVVMAYWGEGLLSLHPVDPVTGEAVDEPLLEGVQHRHTLHVLHGVLQEDGPFAIVAEQGWCDGFAECSAWVELRTARGAEAVRLAAEAPGLPPPATSAGEARDFLQDARDALDGGDYFRTALSAAEAHYLARPDGTTVPVDADELREIRGEAVFLWGVGLFATAEMLGRENVDEDFDVAIEALELLDRAATLVRDAPEPVRERGELLAEIERATEVHRAVVTGRGAGLRGPRYAS